MKKNKHLFLGRAGQLFIVSEFLLHNWNAAIPEVDIGDDVFVVRDKIGEFKRIQVKTVTAKKRNYGYSANFILPYNQLRSPITPELVYFLLIRFEDSWRDYLVLEREKLHTLVDTDNIGTKDPKDKNIQLYFRFHINKKIVYCSEKDYFTDKIKDWSVFQ